MKIKTIAGVLLGLITLSGCTSTPDTYDKNYLNEIKKTETVNFTEKEILRVSDDFEHVGNTFVFVQVLKGEKEAFDDLFLPSEFDTAYLGTEDYLKRLKESDIFITELDSLALFRQHGDNEVKSVHSYVSIPFVESIESEVHNNGEFTETSQKIGVVKDGVLFSILFDVNKETKKDFASIKIKSTELLSLEKYQVDKDSYIGIPDILVDDISTTLTFEKDAHFIKRVNENRLIIVSMIKGLKK